MYTDGARVLRLAAPRAGESARLTVQAAIQRSLIAAGVPTPQVLEVGTLDSGRTYLLEGLAQGDDSGPAAQGWADLGRALAALHALPRSGYGLLEDRDDELRGVARTLGGGLLSRLNLTWPFDASDPNAQALIAAAPDLLAPLLDVRAELLGLTGRPAALCHTDLHGEQFRWQGGRLTALLDFGDAAVGPPEWDVASLAFFHGWPVAAQVAHAAGCPCGREAALFGLLLSLHHAHRATALRRPDRLDRAAAFGRSCARRLTP
ncbi:phosphotransferase family protein [Deinococcus koreensis]|uniref:phosphotransferase family protein n=1 Tax=Deinococcus koreensis TaxID=2054903 RepID=UPI0013FE39A6|nr:aminoglycoside phosphotransferase family protein [Deinococcus koreensis]